MVVPFGIPIGDFLAGITILVNASTALSSIKGAKAEYKDLTHQLLSLQSVLQTVHQLTIGSDDPQLLMIKSAVEDCKAYIDDFMHRNISFSKLGVDTQDVSIITKFKAYSRKIQWALLKQKEVIKFYRSIQQHILALNLLISTYQVFQGSRQTRILTKLGERMATDDGTLNALLENTTSLLVQQESFGSLIELPQPYRRDIISEVEDIVEVPNQVLKNNLATVENEAVETSQTASELGILRPQLTELLSLQRSSDSGTTPYQRRMLALLSTELSNQREAINEIRSLPNIMHSIPPNVPMSSPVIFLDAFGQYAPFYLEFISSFEAFMAILQVRFKDAGLRKVQRREFVLQDTRCKRILNLSEPWMTLIMPGQYIDMSMVFRQKLGPQTSCPFCKSPNTGSTTDCIDWHVPFDFKFSPYDSLTNISESCKRTYRRVVEEETNSDKEGGEYSCLSNLDATNSSDERKQDAVTAEDPNGIYSFKRIIIQVQANELISSDGSMVIKILDDPFRSSLLRMLRSGSFFRLIEQMRLRPIFLLSPPMQQEKLTRK